MDSGMSRAHPVHGGWGGHCSRGEESQGIKEAPAQKLLVVSPQGSKDGKVSLLDSKLLLRQNNVRKVSCHGNLEVCP